MKIAFFHNGNDHFIKPIIEELSKRHETRNVRVEDLQVMFENMVWADVSWFEWCIEPIVQASHLPRVCKNIVRLHRYEALSNFPDRIKWDYVDRLILVTNTLDKYLKDRTGKVKRIVIKNGVDLDKYKFIEKEKGFNVGFVAHLHPRKNLPLALQVIKKLADIDNRYMLYIAGSYQDKITNDYVDYMISEMGLINNVIFCEWVENVNDWLFDINYILSCSIHESFGYGIAEAMSKGCKPVIHNFDGAKKIWHKDFLFNTVDDAVNLITGDFDSKKYRKFIETNYNFKNKIKEIETMLKELK